MSILEIDVTKSMCIRSQKDILAENRLQSIVTDWKTDEHELSQGDLSGHISLNSSQNLDLSMPNINLTNKIDEIQKMRLYLSFPLKRLYALGRGSSSIVYKTVRLNNLKIYAEKVLVVQDPIKKRQIIREIDSLRSMFSGKDESSSNFDKNTNRDDRSSSPEKTYPLSQHYQRRHPISSKFNDEAAADDIQNLETPKVRINQKSSCQYIVELYDVLQNPLDGTLSLCLEYMNNGSLQDIVNKGGCSNEMILSSISYQILCGLSFLHNLRMVHRDVKPSNILLTLDGRIKLSDFGLAKTMDLGHSMADSFIGTFEYMAPERLSGESYSFSSDIWSFGLSIHTLALGKFPYNNKKGFWELLHITQQDEGRPLPSSDLFSSDFISFIASSTVKNLQDRHSASQLLDHTFVSSKQAIIPLELWNEFLEDLERKHLEKLKEGTLSGRKSAGKGGPVPPLNGRASEKGSNRDGAGKPPLPVGKQRQLSPRSSPRTNNSSSSTAALMTTPSSESKSTKSSEKSAKNSTPTGREKILQSNAGANPATARLVAGPPLKSNITQASTKQSNNSTPVTNGSNKYSSPRPPNPSKQASLPSIPTINSTSSKSSSPSRITSKNSSHTNALPIMVPHLASNNPSSQIIVVPTRRLSLHVEKALESNEVLALVSEWGKFVVNYFRYEMKQHQQQHQQQSSSNLPPREKNHLPSSPQKQIPFDKKSLFVTKSVVKSLSADINYNEEKLLELFQCKIKDIQLELGHIIHYFDKKHTVTAQSKKIQEEAGKKLYSPTLLSERDASQQKQLKKNSPLPSPIPLQKQSSLNKNKDNSRDNSPSHVFPKKPVKPSAEVNPSSFHHQSLTVMIDESIPPMKKKSIKSVSDFDSELSPTKTSSINSAKLGKDGNHIESFPSSTETLGLTTLMIDTLQRKEDDGKRKQSFSLRRSLTDNMIRDSDNDTMMIRSLDSKLPNLSPRPPVPSSNLNASSKQLKDLRNSGLERVNVTADVDFNNLDMSTSFARKSSSRRSNIRLSSTSDDDLVTSKLEERRARNTLDPALIPDFIETKTIKRKVSEAKEVMEAAAVMQRSYTNSRKSSVHCIAAAVVDEEMFSYCNTADNSDLEEGNEKERTFSRKLAVVEETSKPVMDREDSVLLDMSSILEESMNQEYSSFIRYSHEDQQDEAPEIFIDEDEDDEIGEQTVETVESFIPSPISTPNKPFFVDSPKLKERKKQEEREERKTKARGSQDYSMVFDETPPENFYKSSTNFIEEHGIALRISKADRKETIAIGDSYDNEEFEEYHDD
jgi:serine/threonine protein kinase